MAEFKNAVMNYIRQFFSQVNVALNMGSRGITTTDYTVIQQTGNHALEIRKENTTLATEIQIYPNAAVPTTKTAKLLLFSDDAAATELDLVITATLGQIGTGGVNLEIYAGSQTATLNASTGMLTLPASLTFPSGGNIVANTVTGTKIGTATSQLLGFYNATPVDQPATVADPSGGAVQDAESRTAIAAIIDRLQELGLIA